MRTSGAKSSCDKTACKEGRHRQHRTRQVLIPDGRRRCGRYEAGTGHRHLLHTRACPGTENGASRPRCATLQSTSGTQLLDLQRAQRPETWHRQMPAMQHVIISTLAGVSEWCAHGWLQARTSLDESPTLCGIALPLEKRGRTAGNQVLRQEVESKTVAVLCVHHLRCSVQVVAKCSRCPERSAWPARLL